MAETETLEQSQSEAPEPVLQNGVDTPEIHETAGEETCSAPPNIDFVTLAMFIIGKSHLCSCAVSMHKPCSFSNPFFRKVSSS